MADATADPDDLAAAIASLEQERKAVLAGMVRLGAIIMGIAGAVAIVCSLAGFSEAGGKVFVGGVIVTIGLGTKVFAAEQRRFKLRLMPKLIACVNPSLRYDPLHFISDTEFTQSGLFKKPDRYGGFDLVEGTVGQTAVRFSLVNAEERSWIGGHNSDDTKNSYNRLFCGLFFIADFNKHFNGRTKVEPHVVHFYDKLFGDHVELEDAEFNEHFSVTSTDQVEARYILTPSLMARLDHLRQKAPVFRTAFVNEHLVLAIDMPLTAFELSVKQPIANSGQVAELLARLKSIVALVEDLDLNTRIWSKE